MIIKYDSGSIEFHDTPWDSRVLDCKCLEIDRIDFEINKGLELVKYFCNKKDTEGYKFYSTRIPATSNNLKNILIKSDFDIVEHTLVAISTNESHKKIENVAKRISINIENFNIQDLSQIENIATDYFVFGRFFEDPFIDNKIAVNRNRFWIKDIADSQCIIKVFKKGSAICGFVAYQEKDNRIDLILGGVRSEYKMFSYGFWAQALFELKKGEYIQTLISSSNIDVLNMYSFFGFKFKNPKFGLHRHVK